MISRPWHEKVKGAPEAAIRRKYREAPDRLSIDFCKRHLWWWHSLYASFKTGKAEGPFQSNRIHLLALMHGRGAMEEWLTKCEQAEWEARLNGTDLPPLSPLAFWNDFIARRKSADTISLAGLTVQCFDTGEVIISKLFAHLKRQGWREPKDYFIRAARTGGINGWRDKFSAVEAVDRYYLLRQALIDSDRRKITARLQRRVDDNAPTRPVRFLKSGAVVTAYLRRQPR